MVAVTATILQFLDWFTTVIGLELGAEEANPLVRNVINIGGYEALIIVKIIAAIFWVVVSYTSESRILARLHNYVYFLIVINNLSVINSIH